MKSISLRLQIRDEVASIHATDEAEAQQREDALAWIDSGEPLFRLEKPATPPKHLVSYFLVVDGDNALLVDHKKAQLWLPTGGHVEPGEHPRTTVTRELFEELGIHAPHEIGPPLMVTCTETVGLTVGHFDVSLWYVVHASKHIPIKFDESEFNGVQWFNFSEVPFERSDPYMRKFLTKLISKIHPVHQPAPLVHANANISADAQRLIEHVFPQEHQHSIIEALSTRCSNNLPLLGDAPKELVERIQFAVVKLCDGKAENLQRHIEVANTDWRDALVAAGFGHSLQAHRNWFNEKMGLQ